MSTTTASSPEVVVDLPRVTAKELGIALCEVFGLDSHGVRTMTIRIVAGEAATLTVEKYIRKSGMDGMASVLKEYILAKEVKVDDE